MYRSTTFLVLNDTAKLVLFGEVWVTRMDMSWHL